MPLITHPQAIRFANEEVRAIADKYAQLYYALDAFLNEWNSQGIGALIPNTADILEDGSAVDGRAVITGAKVNGLVNNLTTLRADLEASSNQKLNVLLQIAVNPTRG
jgi:hypothetical protein